MSIYDTVYETREAAQAALQEQIEEREDGGFVVGGEVRKTREDAFKNAEESRKYRKRAQEAEKTAESIREEYESAKTLYEEMKKSAQSPDEIREKIEALTAEKIGLAASLAKAEKELPQLRDRVAEFETKERKARIIAELRKAAGELNVVPSAFADVERLATDFKVDDYGLVTNESGEDARTALARELESRPHWLPPSQGGGSVGSTQRKFSKSEERRQAFQKARESLDFEAMFLNAPEASVQRR